MLENRIITDDFVKIDNDYDKYLEHLFKEDDRNYEDEIFERLSEEND